MHGRRAWGQVQGPALTGVPGRHLFSLTPHPTGAAALQESAKNLVVPDTVASLQWQHLCKEKLSSGEMGSPRPVLGPCRRSATPPAPARSYAWVLCTIIGQRTPGPAPPRRSRARVARARTATLRPRFQCTPHPSLALSPAPHQALRTQPAARPLKPAPAPLAPPARAPLRQVPHPTPGRRVGRRRVLHCHLPPPQLQEHGPMERQAGGHRLRGLRRRGCAWLGLFGREPRGRAPDPAAPDRRAPWGARASHGGLASGRLKGASQKGLGLLPGSGARAPPQAGRSNPGPQGRDLGLRVRAHSCAGLVYAKRTAPTHPRIQLPACCPCRPKAAGWLAPRHRNQPPIHPPSRLPSTHNNAWRPRTHNLTSNRTHTRAPRSAAFRGRGPDRGV